MKTCSKAVLIIYAIFLIYIVADVCAATQDYVSMRDYVETMFREHEKRQDMQIRASVEALTLSRTELERRLEGLNQLREDVVRDRSLFVRQDTFDAKIKSMDVMLQDVKEQVIAIETKIVTWMTAIAAFFIVIQFGLNYLLRKKMSDERTNLPRRRSDRTDGECL